MTNYSMKARMMMASNGQAMADGSFPIKNMVDLHNAVALVGKSKNPAAAKAHIVKSAKTLGATSQLPAGWTKDSAGDTIAPGAKKDSAGDTITPGSSKDSAGDTVSAAMPHPQSGAVPVKRGLPPALVAYMFKKKGA